MEVEPIRQKQTDLRGMVSTLLSGIHLYALISLVAVVDALSREIARFFGLRAEAAVEVEVEVIKA